MLSNAFSSSIGVNGVDASFSLSFADVKISKKNRSDLLIIIKVRYMLDKTSSVLVFNGLMDISNRIKSVLDVIDLHFIAGMFI